MRPLDALLSRPLGATALPDGRTLVRVWAPLHERLYVETATGGRFELDRDGDGYFVAELDDLPPGSRYWLRFADGRRRPDPASRLLPDGVHGPSEVVDPRFSWTDARWTGRSLADAVLYELHVGTFTPEGTFDAAVRRLDRLVDLGVDTVELMPLAAFPGGRNWGYDGVQPFSVHAAYGGPDGLRRFVDAAHARGLAVVVDVVHNHLGPEGNYLAELGPYFLADVCGPWGPRLNFDGPDNHHVRAFFVQSALQLVRDCHVDGLRCDAVHEILDRSARPFLAELVDAVREEGRRLGRTVTIVAESDHNDPRVVRPRAEGGLGFDAVWCDDFHHAVHALTTGETSGYYADFGDVESLATAWKDGFVYQGQYSRHRRRPHGAPPIDVGPDQFVVFAQNHDQVGNRMLGERLTTLVDARRAELAAAVTLLSPHVPLLFMGEEHGETAPFLYFTSHGDQALADAVREGRTREFAAFAWQGTPPDPQAEETFERSRVREPAGDARRWALYRRLIALGRRLRRATLTAIEADREANTMRVELEGADRRWVVAFAFADGPVAVRVDGGTVVEGELPLVGPGFVVIEQER